MMAPVAKRSETDLAPKSGPDRDLQRLYAKKNVCFERERLWTLDKAFANYDATRTSSTHDFPATQHGSMASQEAALLLLEVAKKAWGR